MNNGQGSCIGTHNISGISTGTSIAPYDWMCTFYYVIIGTGIIGTKSFGGEEIRLMFTTNVFYNSVVVSHLEGRRLDTTNVFYNSVIWRGGD